MIQIDSSFIEIGFSILINVLTQIAKPFHTNPFTVFKIIAFILSISYGIIAFFDMQEQFLAIIGHVIQIVGFSAGAWHLMMRKEGPLMRWWNKWKNGSKQPATISVDGSEKKEIEVRIKKIS